PLVGVRVEAEIRDYGVRVVVIQRYRNDESQPIEAVYKFPLDEAAAVVGFDAVIDGRRVVGHVEEKEKAFAEYDEAMASGHGAYLLDQEQADVFTVSVGNVPPGKEVVLRITTVSELALEGDAIRFTLPTTISPRYAPAEDRRGMGIPEAERVTPPYALAVPYGLSLEVDVQTSAAIRTVESPSHTVRVSIEDRHAVVDLSSRETAMDRDFVLLVTLLEENQPRVLAERGPDGKTYALVSFRPKLDVGFAASEILFLVDRSGSMEGPSIAEARNALQLALRTLRPGCFFNIVGFGSSHSPLFPESQPYNDKSLAAASAYVQAMEADMGGTEIHPALEFVLAGKTQEGRPRQLFVLTDGEVSNTDAVIDLVRRHGGDTRVFTFGIGAAPSHHLVKGLARAGGGEAEFIAPGERIEKKVLRQLNRALLAALTDVRVDWGGLEVEQAPHVVPPVFADGRVLVFGRLDGLRAATVRLVAKSSLGEVSFPLAIEPSAAREGTLVSTLWARRAIRDLEEGCSRLHSGRGSRQRRAAGLEDRVKAEIVRLGVAYGLASRHTSFVAVEERETPVEGEVALRKVPVAISSGWHGIGSPAGPVRLARATGAPMMATSYSVEFCESPQQTLGCFEDLAPLASPVRGRAIAQARRPVDRVVGLQGADGSWDLTKEFAKAVGIGRRELQAALDDVMRRLHELLGQLEGPVAGGAGEDISRRAFATAVALRWLQAQCADTRQEWEGLSQKAYEWLQGASPSADFWLEAVKSSGVLASWPDAG
ncbi:MAG TPA: VIT domain-containing protein, partial [Vicinamibacteria bacterium]|nr:VIT domain-containing protein [Vicinamibacteria bacterium]